MNFVKRDVKAVNGASAVESAAVSDFPAVSRFPAPTAAAHKWPISYESIELISVIADVVVIFSASTLAGVIYHMQAYGTRAISSSISVRRASSPPCSFR